VFNLPDGTPPKLIFYTLFGEGASVGPRVSGGSDRFTETISGVDSVTGFSFDSGSLYDFYGANTLPYILSIYDSTMNVGGTGGFPSWDSCFANSIPSSSVLSSIPGARELLLKCLSRTNPTPEVDPQTALTFARGRVGGVALTDLPNLNYSFDFILQNTAPYDLITQMSSTFYSATNFLTLTEFKTGDYNAGSGAAWGDYRFKVEIRRNTTVNGTKLYFNTALDDNANGLTRIPSCPGPSVTTYQQNTVTGADADGNDICPIGTPLRIEVLIKRPIPIWTRSGAGTPSDPYVKDLLTGRTQVVITNLNTKRSTIIADFVGGVQSGNENLPIQRHIVCNAYSRALAPFEHRMTNLQIWNGRNRVIV